MPYYDLVLMNHDEMMDEAERSIHKAHESEKMYSQYAEHQRLKTEAVLRNRPVKTTSKDDDMERQTATVEWFADRPTAAVVHPAASSFRCVT